jgi:long-chain fatty acid transport protein
MDNLPRLQRLRRFLGIAALTSVLPSAIFAGGMALTLQNGTFLGNTYSGAAAAEDASTIFLNPAGMMWLENKEAIFSAPYVKFDGTFTNTGSLTAGVIPTPGEDERDLGVDGLVPAAYVVVPWTSDLAFGLGISAPFGLGTSYESDWVGRYQALTSKLTVVNVNPALAWQPTEWMSLGAGLNWQYAKAQLSNAIDFGLIGFSQSVPGFVPHGSDGALNISASDSNFGFNLGAMFSLAHGTRFGVHYRSEITQELNGWADFSDVPVEFQALFPDQRASTSLPLPSTFSASFFHDITSSFSVMADWTIWDWSRLNSLTVDFENDLTPDTVLPFDWRDASIYSFGVRWIQNDSFTWRAGMAYNETPVPTPELRNPRIPDSDRIWVGFGVTWTLSEVTRLDFGYAHLDFDKSTTAFDDGIGHVLVGEFAPVANILSAQLTWDF